MNDVTPGGSETFTDDDAKPKETLSVAQAAEGWRDALKTHLNKHFGPCEQVFHESISTTVHLDLYYWKPTVERPFYTVATVGISDAPLNTPAGAEEFQRIELLMYLPADWPIPEGNEWADDVCWPFRTIKQLGHFVHDSETFFAYGHTIPNGNPPEAYASNTALSCALMTQPFFEEPAFNELIIDGTPVTFLMLLPLTENETALKIEIGMEMVLEFMAENDLLDRVLNPGRPCVTQVMSLEQLKQMEPNLEDMYNHAIVNSRRDFTEAQGRMGFFEKRRFKPPMPLWVRMAGAGLKDIYRNNSYLRDNGRLVWGYIVQANCKLFDPDDADDYPAAALYSLDPYYDRHIPEMEAIAAKLFDTEGEAVDDPEVQRFAVRLEDEREIQMKVPIPTSLTDGRELFYTTVMVHRAHLPVPFLVCSAFPLLVAPEKTDATMILPATYWSKEMTAYWMLHFKTLMESEN